MSRVYYRKTDEGFTEEELSAAARQLLEAVVEREAVALEKRIALKYTSHDIYFSARVKEVIYTTNAIESSNSTYRRLNSQKSVFPSVASLMKALYLASFEATKKWSMPARNWRSSFGELSVMFEGRMPV